MQEEEDKHREGSDPSSSSGAEPHRVRLPGFIRDEEIGLADAVKRVTYAMGIRPCGGCEQRAAALNRWMVFTR
jgi:hypothetical protein